MILRNQLGPVRLPDRAELVAFFSAHRLFRVLPAEVLASVADRVGVRRYPRTHILS